MDKNSGCIIEKCCFLSIFYIIRAHQPYYAIHSLTKIHPKCCPMDPSFY